MSPQGTGSIGGADGNDNNVDFGQLTVPAQRLEEMVNWRAIHGTPAEGSQYIQVDPLRLAEIAGTTARFPLIPADPTHAIFLEEGMQKFRDALSARDADIRSVEQLEKDWQNLWAESETIPLGMTDQVKQATIITYKKLAWAYFSDGGTTISFDDMVMAVTAVDKIMERIEDKEFGYNQLHDLQTLAGLVKSGGLKARLAWRLINLLAEGAGQAHKLFAFSIMDLAASGGNDRLGLLNRLAALLTLTSHVSDGRSHDSIVGKTLDLLEHSRLTPKIEEHLLAVINKMLDPSTYPPENSRLRDDRGNILTKGSDIDKLIVNFLDALSVQTSVAGSLPARLLALAANQDVKVNGAFIVLASLSLRQSTRDGILTSYYGEPLFDERVRARLADLSFSPKNINAVDAFLEEQVYDNRRGGGSVPPVTGGGPVYFQIPSGTWGMSAAGIGAQTTLPGMAMITGMPMNMMSLPMGLL